MKPDFKPIGSAAPGRVLPGAGELARNATGALARTLGRLVRGERVRAGAEVVERRQAACAACPYLVGNRCARCGCYVAVKRELAGERCPVGKW